MSDSPKVTVLISAFNVEDYIESSIVSVLEQTHANMEVLVVDDGSADGTFEKISAFSDPRIIAYKQANKGKSATLNDLIEKATGDYIVIQDSDDISPPKRLETLVAAMENDKSLAIAMSGHTLIIDDVVVAPRALPISKEQCKELVEQYKMPAHDPTMMVRASVAKQFEFDQDLSLGEGLDFILAIGERYPMMVVGEVLYQYRIHSSSITKRNSVDKTDQILRVINKARKRRGLEDVDRAAFIAENARHLNDKDNNLAGHFTDSAYQSVANGRRGEAFATALTSARYLKGGLRYVKPLILAFLPLAVLNRAKRSTR